MKLNQPPLFLFLTLLLLPPSAAVAEDLEPSTKFSGLVFSNYHYDLGETPGTPNNQIAIERVYLNFKARITEDFSARVTTDISPVQNSEDQKLRSFLKYAYVEYKGLGHGLKLRFGAAATGFIGKHDQFVGQRWLSKAFTDQAKLLSSSDLGLHLHGEHLGGGVGYQVSIVNGGGYGKAERDDGKAVQARLTVDPLAGRRMHLPLSVFASHDVGHGVDSSGDAIPSPRVLGTAVGFKNNRGLLWVEYILYADGPSQGVGYSLTALPKLSDARSLYARVDHLDPDITTDGDTSTRALIGLTHHFAKKLSAGLLYERRIPEEGDASHGVYLKAQTGF